MAKHPKTGHYWKITQQIKYNYPVVFYSLDIINSILCKSKGKEAVTEFSIFIALKIPTQLLGLSLFLSQNLNFPLIGKILWKNENKRKIKIFAKKG